MDNKIKKVKVNILTGFFGSGKTTLISNIVKMDEIKNKIAIIQNEFSQEMGFEKDTLTDSEGNSLGNLYELPNGCLCCVVKDNVIIFLEKLIQTRSNLEFIILESHGISDISLLLKKFWLDEELESPLYLNSIICLVDCLNFEKNKNEMHEIFVNQIISADKIILNKIDQINYDKDKLHHMKDFIYFINPLAKIVESEYSQVSLEFFKEESAFSVDLNNLADFNQFEENEKHSHEHYHEKENIESIVCKINVGNKNDLDKALGKIIWDLAEEKSFSIIRFKGVFYEDNSIIYSIQGIYDLYEIKDIKVKENLNLNEKISKILFIGKNLKENEELIQGTLLRKL